MQELKDNPPRFIRTESEIYYYNDIIDRLVENGVPLQTQDAYGIATMASNFAVIDECNVSLTEHGAMMRVQGDRKVVSKANPSIQLLKDAQVSLRFYLAQYQMSPNSRGKGLITPPAGGGKGGKDEKGDGWNEL